MADVPVPSRRLRTTLIPIEETISWKIHNVTALLQTNSWTAVTIPLEVGLGATDISRWTISLYRNKNSILCARAILNLSKEQQHNRVTHHLKIAVISPDDDAQPVYYFPSSNDNSTTNNDNNTNNRLTNANNRNRGGGGCRPFRRLRALFRNRLFTGELGEDDESARETGFKGPPTLWRIMSTDKIRPDGDDSMELLLTMTVFGCDVSEHR